MFRSAVLRAAKKKISQGALVRAKAKTEARKAEAKVQAKLAKQAKLAPVEEVVIKKEQVPFVPMSALAMRPNYDEGHPVPRSRLLLKSIFDKGGCTRDDLMAEFGPAGYNWVRSKTHVTSVVGFMRRQGWVWTKRIDNQLHYHYIIAPKKVEALRPMVEDVTAAIEKWKVNPPAPKTSSAASE